LKDSLDIKGEGEKTEEVANFLGLLYDQMAMVESQKAVKVHFRKKSEQYHKRALSINKKSLEAYLGLGRLFMHKNRFTRAMYYYKQALKIDRKSHHAFNGLGNVYLRLGTSKNALRWYRKALGNAKEKAIILANIARLHRDDGNTKLAKHTATQALTALKKEKREQTTILKNLVRELRRLVKQA